MDSNIMKFLEEDEDETMPSGADVDAFTAALNRDIEGDTSTSRLPSSDNAVLSQGSSQTSSSYLSQWQASSHDESINFRSEHDLTAMEQTEQHSSQSQLQQGGPESENQKTQSDQNNVSASQSMSMQIPEKNSVHTLEADPEENLDTEAQLRKLQNMSNQQTMAMGLNNQHKQALGTRDQLSMSTGTGNQQTTAVGMGNEQALGMGNQHAMGAGISSQQSITSGMNNQQTVASNNQQQGNSLKLGKQVPFGLLLPIIQPQLDKDRAMQLHTLYFKLKKNEISKDVFVRHMRSVVGDQMLKMAVYKLQTQQAARNTQTAPNQIPLQPQASARQPQMPSTDSTSDSALKSQEVERQVESHGMEINQMASSTLKVSSHERKQPTFPIQGLNKQQQQHLHFSQASFPTYGSPGSSYPPYSATSLRQQPHDSQMRQATAHQNMNANQLGPTTQAMNMMNVPKFGRPNAFGEPKKMQPGALSHTNNNTTLQQNPVQWPSSSSKEQKIGVSSSMSYVKQEPVDQSNDQQHKVQLSSPQASSLSSVQVDRGNAAGNLKDESFEMHSSRMGFARPTSMLPTNSVPSSITSHFETNTLSNSRIPSLIGPGNNSKAAPKKISVGQKKPPDALGSSPPPSSKKQKVSGDFLDQSIEQLNDVTAVSGVNIREEEEQLFSGSKEEFRDLEASRRVVQEEEERLMLHKIPLEKKLTEIMAKCGLKNISNDVERCLSLCVEERMRGLITNLIRLSKQRVDTEKPRHRTVITSNVRQQIMIMNKKAREEWEKKQAETEKLQKQNEPESATGVDGDKEKDENRVRSAKANKEEDDKMRATAANVAVRAATGVGDMLSRWQLMIEAKQKQGGTDVVSDSQSGKDVVQKPLPSSARRAKENQEAEKRGHSVAINTPEIRRVGRNQVAPRVARIISVKDVIAVLEREPQMLKSTLIYRLYEKLGADAAGE
ncbi:transcription initiation factor TFIID subunit 4b isoform X1 [Olea europaea subsp. europaea]|uniref:Transcription initiation factor TFIID subunit 4b isoform X1 n=1 Tax=Olea europaea subsp. europaea TaxID=158383 RepID=A0A8S0T2X0_OLEEU|nr:transcription initiation factor TFIID subunit 4b isoform X1 [Olea europaea subsp. europaea]